MNRLFYIFAFIVALACVGCNDYCEEQEYQRNKAELMRIRKKAKQHKSIADETGIDTLVVFFEQYGTEEDEFTALFYKAWHLLYNEQYEQAYLLFRGLQDSLPKDHTELMSDIMRSIYTALQLISEKEGDIETAEKWWRISEKSGVYTKAYHYMLSQNKAWIMHEKGIDDSCKYYMDQSFEEMQETADWDDNKSFCLSEQTAHFAMLGDLDGFKCRNELLKQHPYAGENGSTDLNTGLMLLKEGKRDSAIICFKRATVSTDEVALAAYAQLAIDANNNGPKDSVFNYYQRSMERWNSMFRQKNESFTKRLEATLHNQELSTQLAQQKIKVLTLFLCFTIAILLAIVGWWLTMLTRKKLQRDLLRLETAKKEKEELEMQLQRVLDEIKSNKESDSSQELMEKVQRLDTLAMELKQYADNKTTAPHQLCEDFVLAFAEINSNIITKLQRQYAGIRPNDILLCILVSQNFKLTDIARITNHDRQEIRQFMLRISKGLTGEPIGRMEDFKAMLDERFFGEDNE